MTRKKYNLFLFHNFCSSQNRRLIHKAEQRFEIQRKMNGFKTPVTATDSPKFCVPKLKSYIMGSFQIQENKLVKFSQERVEK